MLRLDYEALASSSKTLSQQGDIFEDCINTMSQVISELPDIWEAETCDKYVEQFDDAKPTLLKVRELIEDMSAQMQKISDNFAQADIDEASGSPGFSQKSNAGMEIYETIKQFYQKETETFGEKFACAGISYYPNADEITIDDKLVRIIRTDEFHGKTIYLWQVEVDLENMDFFDVEYLF